MAKHLRDREHRTLIRLLRQVREEKKIRQVDLAKMVERPQSYVSKYENGERRLDFLEIRDICLAVKIDLPTFIRRFEAKLKQRRVRTKWDDPDF